MDSSLSQIIMYCLVAVLTGAVGFIFSKIEARLTSLENRMLNTITEKETRQILSDKIDPLKEDMKEIKDSINKLMDLALADRVKPK